MAITMDDYGVDLFDPNGPVRLELRDAIAAMHGPRVGVSQAADRAWRFWLPGYPEVSAYRRSPRAPAPGESD
jgi:DNA-3-methyladenine glycosylase